MNALSNFTKLTLMLSGERMLKACLEKRGIPEDQLENELDRLQAPFKEYAETLPQDDASGLKLYKEHVGADVWEGLSRNPIILDLAKAHVLALITPKIRELFDTVKVWIDDPEFSEEHFNLLFGFGE